MIFNLDVNSIEELKTAVTYDAGINSYQCLLCGKQFQIGEIFPIDGRFFEAKRAIELHIKKEHESVFDALINSDNKYNSLTDNQKELLKLLHNGSNDAQISKDLGITASTVRHHKFMFREKAKQAKMYLALYELACDKKVEHPDEIITVHEGATMVDDRYLITNDENEKIINLVFESLKPLKMKEFPPREKKKIVALRVIASQFEKGKRYKESEVNATLKSIYSDYPTLRRYLLEYGFMDRTRDCKEYWLK
ncbi:MAG TPA: DUF2087 domain-containing protein [Lachnospiraceae bacterium]|nr:DUF2087 domain-containing protein [Lachnospiraceae bacterium]